MQPDSILKKHKKVTDYRNSAAPLGVSEILRFTGATILLIGLLFSVNHSSHAATDIERGRQIAENQCARCHSIAREGDSPHKDAPAFRILSAKYPLEHLQEALAEGISVGHRDMPEFEFNPDDIDHLIGFLNWLNNP